MQEILYMHTVTRIRADGSEAQDIKYHTYYKKYEKCGRPRHVFTEAEQELIRTKLEAGVKKAVIAREIGISRPVLYKFIREH